MKFSQMPLSKWFGTLTHDVEENTLDAFIRLLRSKVDREHAHKLIQAVRGVGGTNTVVEKDYPVSKGPVRSEYPKSIQAAGIEW